MSKSIVLGLLGLWLGVAACQSHSDELLDVHDTLISRIAQDPAYLNMLQAQLVVQEHYHFQLEAVSAFMQRAETTDEICQLVLDPATETPGIRKFQTDLCDWVSAARLLRQKYPAYQNLTAAEHGQLMNACRDYTGFDYVNTSMQQALTNN